MIVAADPRARTDDVRPVCFADERPTPEPDVIFADEPTSRLDPISQQETLDVLVDEAQRSGAALMLVTHDPAIAANVGQQVLAPFS